MSSAKWKNSISEMRGMVSGSGLYWGTIDGEGWGILTATLKLYHHNILQISKMGFIDFTGLRHHQTNKDERATDHQYRWALIRAKQLSVALPSLFVWWLGRRSLCVPLAMDQLYWPGQVGVIPSDFCHLSLITDFRRYSYSNEIKYTIDIVECTYSTYAYQHIKTTGCIAVHTACSS